VSEPTNIIGTGIDANIDLNNVSLLYDASVESEVISTLAQQTACKQVYNHKQFGLARNKLLDHTTSDLSILKLDSDEKYGHRISLTAISNLRQTSCVDFNSTEFIYRLQHSNTIKQAIARAMGIKKGLRPAITDATAGLGRDGFILASLGCDVTYIERSAVIHALLEDGLRRAAQQSIHQSTLKHIRLISGDSIGFLSQERSSPLDVIYLDPMYPARSKHALVKKEMRMIRHIVGKDNDVATLFQAALESGAKRVVVKRPKGAELLSTTKPSFELNGKTTRYDVYINHC